MKEKSMFFTALGFVVGLFTAIGFIVMCFPYMALAIDETGTAKMMCAPVYESSRKA